MDHSRTFTHYWLAWAVVTFLAFLGPEVYALVTNWRNTLSAQVWRFLNVQAGQPLAQWSAGHFLFAGIYGVVTVWLGGHFLFRWWAS